MTEQEKLEARIKSFHLAMARFITYHGGVSKKAIYSLALSYLQLEFSNLPDETKGELLTIYKAEE